MYSIVKGMVKLAESFGVKIHLDSPVEEILLENKKAVGVKINGQNILSDIVLSGADYHHTETLLPKDLRAYSEAWNKKTFAPFFAILCGIEQKGKKCLPPHLVF